MNKDIVILGAGISGISASYHLKEKNISSVVFEKNSSWGGLLDNFEINGFRFDRFVHLSFAVDEHVKDIFAKSTDFYTHIPDPFNYYKGYWIKHPAQNNLYPLPSNEKNKILADFKKRKKKDISEIKNYDEWLRVQFGDYFAENFPIKYTKKYWTVPAKDLETKWVGKRLYTPSIEEVEKGCETDDTPVTYYAKEMRYPKKGGYKSFLKSMVNDLDIRLNKEVLKIDLNSRHIYFSDGTHHKYDKLISSLPLPEICKLIEGIPEKVVSASEKLLCTSGYLVSLGFNKPDIPKNLWFYIYDEDILSARVYSPSLKSPENSPVGCSSLQAEIYFSKYKDITLSEEEILQHTIDKLIKMKIFEEKDLVVKNIKKEDYANVVFDHKIYENRKIVLDFLKKMGIISVGRFGEWKYLWSDQSLISGQMGADKLIKEMSK
ncbi:FAD-dependent oxidoreductase [uncultured Ilyobacter sp.]|uniref:protoporphyrinogen/coproporphyrinogen oxidase n=1 Tax=uncultured Ilyobacter sp. TaxID=544433 RepID=UPI002AA91954|nr:FAD-dependent oxidoreductase [uncultured Ilyobacter sp.]